MVNNPDWLPSLVLLAEYNGDWDRYLAGIYQYFQNDFIKSQPSFSNVPVRIMRHEISQGKEATFWHIISNGKSEVDRVIDTERCKRIRWPRSIIENHKISGIRVWENLRGREKRILFRFICNAEDYLVVLSEHKGHIYLLTAYCVTWESQKNKLQKEYEQYKANTAL